MEKRGIKIAAQNRKAHHDYFVEDSYEAGIELAGTEVKSIRMGNVNLKDAFCTIKDGQMTLNGMHVSPYEKGNIFNRDPDRPKRLLMHKREIMRLYGRIKQDGYALIPLSLYFKNSKVKVEIGLAKGKKLIANPGCYPTASTLGLQPMLKTGHIVENTIVIDATSGYTGAGRRPALFKLLTEAENYFCAYALGGGHRHTPEIEQNIAYITGKDLMKPETWQYINFQPHLLPQVRGIEVTIYATCDKDFTNEEVYELYKDFYKDEPFVKVFPANLPVQTKWAYGTNFVEMTPTFDSRTHRLIVSSVIDNIGKGAAGQAIQNMNLIMGLPETTGLMMPPMYP